MLAKLASLTRPTTAPSVVREAFVVLTQKLETIEVPLTKHSVRLGDQVAVNLLFEERHLFSKTGAGINQSQTPLVHFPSNFSTALLFRSLKTSAKATSKTPKPQKAVLELGPPRATTPNQDASKSITSRLAENLSRARSLQQAAPATLASAAASLESSSSGANMSSSVHEARGAGGEASQPRFSGSEEERKGSKVVRVMAVMILGYIGWNIYPLMGESMVSHAVALTQSKVRRLSLSLSMSVLDCGVVESS